MALTGRAPNARDRHLDSKNRVRPCLLPKPEQEARPDPNRRKARPQSRGGIVGVHRLSQRAPLKVDEFEPATVRPHELCRMEVRFSAARTCVARKPTAGRHDCADHKTPPAKPAATQPGTTGGAVNRLRRRLRSRPRQRAVSRRGADRNLPLLPAIPAVATQRRSVSAFIAPR